MKMILKCIGNIFMYADSFIPQKIWYLENIYFLLGFICFGIFIIFRIIICDGQTYLILLIFHIFFYIIFF